MNQLPAAFWSVSANGMLQQLGATGAGLSGEEARQRLARYGSNLLKPQKRSNTLALLLGQFKSPIILLLLFATGLSFLLHEGLFLISKHCSHSSRLQRKQARTNPL